MKSFLKGRINNGLTDVECLIRDLSATGARLILSGGISMPGVIDLHIPMKKQTMRAQVDWRNGDEMGLSFIADLRADATPAARHNPELTERVVKLEAEIACLCNMLVRLRGEIFPNQDLDEANAYRNAIHSASLARS